MASLLFVKSDRQTSLALPASFVWAALRAAMSGELSDTRSLSRRSRGGRKVDRRDSEITSPVFAADDENPYRIAA
jgi:hypothetical protein